MLSADAITSSLYVLIPHFVYRIPRSPLVDQISLRSTAPCKRVTNSTLCRLSHRNRQKRHRYFNIHICNEKIREQSQNILPLNDIIIPFNEFTHTPLKSKFVTNSLGQIASSVSFNDLRNKLELQKLQM